MYYYVEEENLEAGILYCAEKELSHVGLKGTQGIPAGIKWKSLCFLFEREPHSCRSVFALSQDLEIAVLQMAQKEEDVYWLNRRAMESMCEEPPGIEAFKAEPEILELIQEGRGMAVNLLHPNWRNLACNWTPKKKRVNILAIGDVGSTLMMGLKLLGGDVIESIGICDIDEKVTTYWEYEMNQTSLPWDYDSMPEIEVIQAPRLFDCDVFIFCASKGIPPVGSEVADVRMVQFEQNAAIVARYAKMARKEGFQGLFAVVSDPVDPLCKTAFLESNRDENGNFDCQGLRAEQIQGYGLGVMNARAAYFAKRDGRFSDFLTEGRAFGPHGEDLVIANSIEHYDDQRSRELTQLAVTANLRVREAGFKPFVAPALSSGALSILLTLRGQWHYSSTFLGGVFMGAKNRFTPMGIETDCIPLPASLYSRIQLAAEHLKKIV